MRTSPAAALLTLLFAAGTLGCSGYGRRSDAALAAPHKGIAGPWEGTWKSNKNDHSGALRCIVTPLDENRHHFHWWASWGRLSGDYEIDSPSRPGEGRTHQLEMAFDLGELVGGTYTLKGHATPTDLHATYHSKVDHGILTLGRPNGG